MSKLTSVLSDVGARLSAKLSGNTDASLFDTVRMGVVPVSVGELRSELSSQSVDVRIRAVKRIIAYSTTGRDMTALMADVVNCMASADLHLKKIVYLYLVFAACEKPSVAILAINTFTRDCADANPLIRAVALRTLASIHLHRIMTYAVEPVRNGMKDPDPYVRRTACTAVAKLYQTSPSGVVKQELYGELGGMVLDESKTVGAAAVQALIDISKMSNGGLVFNLNNDQVPGLLSMLNSVNEWGQVSVLTALASYKPRNVKEAEAMILRTEPRLSHANPAVVLAAVRVIVTFVEHLPEEDRSGPLDNLVQPLQAQLFKRAEIKFVALRVIMMLIEAAPSLVKFDLTPFFVSHDDPGYVQRVKLKIVEMLVDEKNAEVAFEELEDYIYSPGPLSVESIRSVADIVGRLGSSNVATMAAGIVSQLLNEPLLVPQVSLVAALEALYRIAKLLSPSELQSVQRQAFGMSLLNLTDRVKAPLALLLSVTVDKATDCAELKELLRKLQSGSRDERLWHALISLAGRGWAVLGNELRSELMLLLTEGSGTSLPLDVRDRCGLLLETMTTSGGEDQLRETFRRPLSVSRPVKLPSTEKFRELIMQLGSASGVLGIGMSSPEANELASAFFEGDNTEDNNN